MNRNKILQPDWMKDQRHDKGKMSYLIVTHIKVNGRMIWPKDMEYIHSEMKDNIKHSRKKITEQNESNIKGILF